MSSNPLPLTEEEVIQCIRNGGRSTVPIHQLARALRVRTFHLTALLGPHGTARIGITDMNGVYVRSTRTKEPKPNP